MNILNTKIFLNNFKFTEGIRWHQNCLWFCDVWDHKVYCFDLNGNKVKEIRINDKPVGLGWLSDGSLLITSLLKRQLLHYREHQLSLYKNLDIASPGYCHDFTVGQKDTIYLSASGFLPAFNAKPIKSNIFLITKNKEIKIAATNMGYPNGIKITPDGKNLIVAESFSAKIITFKINSDGTLTNKKLWTKFDNLGFQVTFNKAGIPKDTNRHYPDGLCFDSKLNAVWVASPGKKQVLCVAKDSKILATVNTFTHPFDCILGGEDGRTLFIASSGMEEQHNSGQIEYTNV